MGKILLINDLIDGVVSGEKTFWSVLAESFSEIQPISLNSFNENLSEYIYETKPSIIIINSIFGDVKVPPGVKKIVLLQDNFVAMGKLLPFTLRSLVIRIINTRTIKKQKTALFNADLAVAVSQDIAKWYGIEAEIIPIGTDTELFKPMNRTFLRNKYNIPQNRFVKIYVGSSHPVKGWDLIRKEIERNKDDFYILVFKDEKIPRLGYKNIKTFQRVPQTTLAELYNCADLFVGRSRVESLWLTSIEAMFCNLPIDVTPTGIFADWLPQNKSPRQEAFEMGLDRETMIEKWKKLIKEIE